MSYIEVLQSKRFENNLRTLNASLIESLNKKNYRPVLLGNLFYDHLEFNFHTHTLNSLLDEKRKRLFDVARKSTSVFEVGVNGGHSALLMLEANPELIYTGIDIASFYPQEPLCHPEVYVPAAFSCLHEIYSKRVSFITGNSILEIPNYCKNIHEPHIDLLHLDGAKGLYEKDFYAILPALKNNAYVVFDDTQQPVVQGLVDRLLAKGIVIKSEYPKMSNTHKYTHEIVKIIK
jgi:predicted O-methyltransferase YrrM